MKEVTVSYSEIKDARRCEFKHYLNYVQGWSAPERHPSHPLIFGTAWHEVLDTYYSTLMQRTLYGHGWERGPSAWRESVETIKHQPEEIQEQLRWMLEGYAAHYGTEPGWKVEAVERKLVVPLPILSKHLKVNLKVKIDLIIKDKWGNRWVDDHKTCAQLPSPSRMIDDQLPLYAYALEQEGMPVHGARYSYSRKPSKTFVDWDMDKRFRRRLDAVPKRVSRTVACDAYRTVYNRYASQARWKVSPPKTRQDDCSRCDFEKACKANDQGRPIDVALLDLGFTRWREEPKKPEEETNELDAGN